MKRVYIKVPGKLIQYANYPVSRTPLHLDVNEKDLERLKGFLKFQGILESEYEITDIDNVSKSRNTKLGGLKTVKLGAGRTGMSLKVK
jgi:hypothetical protein